MYKGFDINYLIFMHLLDLSNFIVLDAVVVLVFYVLGCTYVFVSVVILTRYYKFRKRNRHEYHEKS